MKKIKIISNFTVKPFFVSYFDLPDIKIEYLNLDESLLLSDEEKYSAIFLWLNVELLFKDILNNICMGKFEIEKETKNVVSFLETIHNKINKLSSNIIVAGFDDGFIKEYYFVNNMNEYSVFIDRLNKWLNKRYIFIDIKQIVLKTGFYDSYNIRYMYHWDIYYSEIVFKQVASELCQILKKDNYDMIKCIILDCDNVLWSGTLNEDGYEKIIISSIGLGRLYKDFQRLMLSYYNHGIILAISSKNSYNDILSVFENHSDMLLKKHHIAYFAVNWDNKTENINKISQSLNINHKNILFIDDSDYEIKEVKYFLPTVKTLSFNKYHVFRDIKSFNFAINDNFENNKLRQLTYQADKERHQLKSFMNYDEFLNAQELKIDIKLSIKEEISRIVELSQRTNRCTNGKRYSVSEIINVISNNNYILKSVYVSDKFGDLGLVGTYGIYKLENGVRVDLFCLSCRAIGKKIEDKMINDICSFYGNILQYDYFPTDHNDNFRSLIKSSMS